jgi:hypothetical protein
VPTTYVVDGKQYVAVWAGWGGAGPIWGGQMANDPAVKSIPKGGHLYVFAFNKVDRTTSQLPHDPRRGAHAPRRGAPFLNVCVDEANPTAAMDLRVARAAAKTQGYSVKLVSFVGYGKGGDGFPPGRFAKMAQSECQLIMGFPVDVSNPNLPPNVEATSAYASTGFVLVRRGGSAKMSLSELPQGQRSGHRPARYLCRAAL